MPHDLSVTQLRFAVDENFNNRIVRGMRLQCPGLDVLRIQDTIVYGADDTAVLEWCALEGRILLTHDVTTMIAFARKGIAVGKILPGIIAVPTRCTLKTVIAELVLMYSVGNPDDFTGKTVFLPL